MKLKKRFEITKRGYELLSNYCPGLIKSKVVSALIESLSPFITIWFSAQIINEIAGERRIDTLICYVLLTIVIQYIFSMVKNVMDKMIGEKKLACGITFQRYLQTNR